MSHKFEKDFKEVNGIFPKLKFEKQETLWKIFGEIDICDKLGEYWNTFEIEIYVLKSYPYCIPLLQEKGGKISREDDWHIDKDGFCCVDIPHKLLVLERRGINISDFIRDKVYPYFANQIYKKNANQYAAGEYKHNFDGIYQFYTEDLKFESIWLIVDLLQKLVDNEIPERNEPCPCGQGKFKDCHFASVEFLKSLPKEQLEKDLKEFIEYEKETNP